MAIKLPHSKFKSRSASAPKAPVGEIRKPAYSRALPASYPLQRWQGHYKGQPGAILRETTGLLATPKPACGSIHGKPADLGPPLSIREVAQLIGCSPWTVRQTLIPRGLPFFRSAANGRLIFYTDQIVRWIETQQRKGGFATK